MGRVILIYGHPGAGKSYAFKTLNPSETILIDADNKGALPWRGFKKDYNAAKKNFFSIDTLDKIFKSLVKIVNDESYKHITTIAVDGFNNALANEQAFYDDWHNPKNPYEKYAELAKKAKGIIRFAQNITRDLNVIFTAHVECADGYKNSDVDHMFTPGKQLQDKYRIEGSFNYVFYAKVDGEGKHFFETQPVNSTAKTPEGCFPPTIPNDMQAILNAINDYEFGGDANE